MSLSRRNLSLDFVSMKLDWDEGSASGGNSHHWLKILSICYVLLIHAKEHLSPSEQPVPFIHHVRIANHCARRPSLNRYLVAVSHTCFSFAFCTALKFSSGLGRSSIYLCLLHPCPFWYLSYTADWVLVQLVLVRRSCCSTMWVSIVLLFGRRMYANSQLLRRYIPSLLSARSTCHSSLRYVQLMF